MFGIYGRCFQVVTPVLISCSGFEWLKIGKMEVYTKEQVDQMLSSAIDQTMGFAENGGIMDEQQSQELMKRAFVHPSTGLLTQEETQKQIEAVRGLIVIQKLLPLTIQQPNEVKQSEELKELQKDLTKRLKELTATLKPYLNGEKLEV